MCLSYTFFFSEWTCNIGWTRWNIWWRYLWTNIRESRRTAYRTTCRKVRNITVAVICVWTYCTSMFRDEDMIFQEVRNMPVHDIQVNGLFSEQNITGMLGLAENLKPFVPSLSTQLRIDQNKISRKHNLRVRKSPQKLSLFAYAQYLIT